MISQLPLAFVGVGLTVLYVASITLAILVLALLAASAFYFFRSVDSFDDDVRAATMAMSPGERARFFAIYRSLHPKNPAVAWFMAVILGPIGANLYRGEWLAFAGAVVSLNGLGAWWIESWYSTCPLVLLKNRGLIAYALEIMRDEAPPEAKPTFATGVVASELVPALVAR